MGSGNVCRMGVQSERERVGGWAMVERDLGKRRRINEKMNWHTDS